MKRLQELSDDRLAKKALKQLEQDDQNGQYNWVSQANSIKQAFDVSTNESVYRIKHKIKENYNEQLKQNIANCLSQRKKLRTYTQFKTTIKFEHYLEYIYNFSIRIKLPSTFSPRSTRFGNRKR